MRARMPALHGAHQPAVPAEKRQRPRHSLTVPALVLAALLAAAVLWTRGSGVSPPVLKFGLVADAQYADAQPAKSVLGVWRYYNQSLAMLADAARHFQAVGDASFVVHLGDLVDGKAAAGQAGAPALLDAAQQALKAGVPVHLLLGNHELYVHTRAALLKRYGIVPAELPHRGGGDHSYYSVTVSDGVRLLFVDTYDISILGGRPPSDARVAAAKELLLRNNPAYNASGGTSSGNDPTGLRWLARSWVALNGGVGPQQLTWLAAQLAEARAQGQRVLVFSHIALHPRAQSARCAGMCVVWDWEEVLAVLRPYGDIIAACFAGHDHSGGYARDSGIHYITVQGIIETRLGGAAYAEVALYPDRLVVRGHGRVTSRNLKLGRMPPLAAALP